jgi:phage terminase Nu1 subunit (DNA packaging protein)
VQYIDGTLGKNAQKRRVALKQSLKKQIESGKLPPDLQNIITQITDPVQQIAIKHEAEKLEWTRERRIGVQLRNLETKGQLVPTSIVATWMSLFTIGLRNNLLSVGERVARGDAKLRAKIEKELEIGIQRTIDNVAAGLRDSVLKNQVDFDAS